MTVMRLFVLATLGLCSLSAQSPTDVFDKAPPTVDKALRERLDIFMQAHISGKFRLAEKVIHEDSQDIYYDSQKSRYLSYEVVRINWAENFTKATVVTAVEMDWYTARLGKLRVKPPLTTMWKLDKGEWWWYAIPQKEWKTPFGTMNPGADPKTAAPPKYTVPDASALYKQLEVSKLEIPLSSWQPAEDSAEITNKMPGEITLTVERAALPVGLSVDLTKTTVNSGDSAKITFKYEPPDRTVKNTQTVVVRVAPTNQTIEFTVTFAVPPEMEKYLKKK